ncbi:MAG: endonuclease/exonuclease/phosphatase family protein, partial [Bacteroidota bacterium]
MCSLESPPAVICLTETWLTENDTPALFRIPGYSEVFSKCRSSKGGGLMIQVKKDINFVKTIPCELDEALAVELSNRNVKFQIAVIYNPPKINKQEFLEVFDNFLANFKSATIPVIVCGDFNIDISKNNNLVSQLLNVHASNGFTQVINGPTRVCETSESCLDHVLIKNVHEFETAVLDDCFSDHFPILLKWHLKREEQVSSSYFRDLSILRTQAGITFLNEVLSENLKIFIIDRNDINKSFNSFVSICQRVLNELLPMRMKNQMKTTPGWLTKDIKKLISKRNQLHRQWRTDRSNKGKREKFVQAREKVEFEIKATKKKYYCQKFTNCIGDSRRTYTFLNELSGKSKHIPNILALSSTDATTGDTNDHIAESFDN